MNHQKSSHQAPSPQAILTPGGCIEREKFAAAFAQQHLIASTHI